MIEDVVSAVPAFVASAIVHAAAAAGGRLGLGAAVLLVAADGGGSVAAGVGGAIVASARTTMGTGTDATAIFTRTCHVAEYGHVALAALRSLLSVAPELV
jgi:hypothetical protein